MKLVPVLVALLTVPFVAHADLVLTSPAMKDGGILPDRQVLAGFGCTGPNLSPALAWSGAPQATQSFVLTAYDPDAPTGSGWWHWTVVNIPATTSALPEGASATAMPDGSIEARTDFGTSGFGGACPPEGTAPHRYVFTLYAMPQASIPLDASASGAMVGFFARSGALEQASLTVTYGR
jgi:Raf kinase inhibitor-like YbhB/YbcL family protein